MARAYFNCAECGALISVTGYNRKDADSKAVWAQEQGFVCRSCQARRNAEKSAQDAANNAAQGLPPLSGSPAQVRWAETLRTEELPRLLGILDQKIASVKEEHKDEAERLGTAIRETLRGQNNAKFWIENRGASLDFIITREEFQACVRRKMQSVTAPDAPADVRDESLLRPENPYSTVPVEVRVEPSEVTASYPKDERFIGVLKSLHFGWKSPVWKIHIDAVTGPAEERAAELIAALLRAGFTVACQDTEALRRALEGDYRPMHPRWLSANSDKIGIVWAEGDFFAEARKIPGSAYTGNRLPLLPRYTAPPRSFEHLLSFAELHDFRMTPGAQRLLDAAREKYESALLVRDLPEPKAASAPVTDKDEFGVADELRDD